MDLVVQPIMKSPLMQDLLARKYYIDLEIEVIHPRFAQLF